jgi:deoxycytidylate deaminase
MKKILLSSLQPFIEKAVQLAKESTCSRAQCGTVIVKNDEIIGQGYNSPAANKESQRRCTCEKNQLHPKVTDKTCCIHAEQRAIIDALKNNQSKIENATLIFVRIDKQGNIEPAGKPYCTICSKLALDTGIKEFILLHKEGPVSYNTEEYNSLSYQYNN